MKLKMFNYNVQLEYAPGKTIQLADYLSRYMRQTTDSEEDKTITQAILSINVSDERKKEMQKETENDSILKQIKLYCQHGWPNNKSKCPNEIRYFYRLKDDIFLEDNLLFYNDRLIIPNKMKREILNKLHEPHSGINKTLERARMSVYWPNIKNEIENIVMKCTKCQMNAPSNRNEPMVPHEIPDRPFVKIGCDVLEHQGKDYLIVIDYYSKWIELIKLKRKTAGEINLELLRIFSRFGYPHVIISDNMPMGSFEAKQFANAHDIRIITSSPRYPKSNGLAERAVQIAKKILRKASSENEIYESLLAYRTTPVKNMNYSPAQLLQNRILRSNLPMHEKKFNPSLCKDVPDQLKKKQEKMKEYYDRTAKQRNTFHNKQKVLFINNNKWQCGQIINKHETPRSFVIQSNGRVYRRNTKHVRPFCEDVEQKPNEKNKSPELNQKRTRSGRQY